MSSPQPARPSSIGTLVTHLLTAFLDGVLVLLVLRYIDLEDVSTRYLFGVLAAGYLVAFSFLQYLVRPFLWTLRLPRHFKRATVSGLKAFSASLTHNKMSVVTFSRKDRAADEFRNRLKHHILQSRIVYFRLLTAHTMFYDPAEQFLLDQLEQLSPEQRQQKDLRVQLLDPKDPSSQPRGEWFFEHVLRPKSTLPVRSYPHYVTRCREIEEALRQLGFRVHYYNTGPNWRWHIFDDAIFVSCYGPAEEGHHTPCTLITRGRDEHANSLYRGFLAEFKSLYPPSY